MTILLICHICSLGVCFKIQQIRLYHKNMSFLGNIECRSVITSQQVISNCGSRWTCSSFYLEWKDFKLSKRNIFCCHNWLLIKKKVFFTYSNYSVSYLNDFWNIGAITLLLESNLFSRWIHVDVNWKETLREHVHFTFFQLCGVLCLICVLVNFYCII